MRPIDADWFKSSMLDEPTEWMTEEQCVQFRAMIDLAPIVDAVPVRHGRWIHHKGGYSDHYECTACGKPIVLTAKWDFCPNCGAKMDGKGER